MIIDTLKLKDFRNYEALEITPHPGVNLLFGQNGSGKTNLLEAVHYCAVGRSHRTSQDMEVVRKGAASAAVGVTVRKADGRHDVAVKLTPNEIRKKHVFIDNKRAAKLGDMMGKLQCVIFSPEDLMLVKDGPSVRRKFLDMMISQLSPQYFVALQQYQKAMEQRNALLREAKKGARLDRAMLEAFEHGMAAPGEKIILERRKMLATISDCAARKYEQISGRPGEHFHMAYECCLEGDDDLAQRIIDGLSRSRQEDMIRATTSFGVHREDIDLTLMGRQMKLFASQGQIRTAALSIKLAQLEVFRTVTGEAPILLLDDVMSELDMNRRTRLIDEISGVQTFITCTDASDIDGSLERRSYQVRMTAEATADIRALSEGEAYDVVDVDEDPDFS